MVHHDNTHDNVNINVSKDESIAASSEEDSTLRPYMSRRESIRNILHSHKFQVGIIILVIIDCLLVIGELMLDVKILELHEESHLAPHVLHYMSIAILSIFVVEIIVKVYALGVDFFHHKLEVFDAFVVILSFGLDIAFQDPESLASSGFGLVIILRLWRVARILNGVVLSVKTQSEHKLLKERRLKDSIEQEFMRSKDYIVELENEICYLRQFLKQHGIKDLPPSIIEDKIQQNTIAVVAEVNHNQPSDVS